MSRLLFAYLSEDGSRSASFYDPDDSNFVEADDLKSGDQLVFLAHGCAVTSLSVIVPAKSDREARLAAPFAIEDEIGNDVEDVHIAFGERPADLKSERQLFVVSKDQMKLWTDTLKEFSAYTTVLTAEQSVVPEGQVLLLDDRVIGTNSSGPFAVDIQLGQGLLEVVTEGLSSISPESDGLQELAVWYQDSSSPVNLLQGSYKTRGSGASMGVAKAWRLPMVLAAVLGVAWLASLHMETQAYRSASDAMNTDLQEAYQAAFPGERAPSNVLRAMRRKMSGGTGDDGTNLDFLQTTAALYTAIDDVEAARLRSLRFEPRRGGLFASMTYEDYGFDADLKSLLEEVGYTVRIGDARRTDDGVQGDVIVEGLR